MEAAFTVKNITEEPKKKINSGLLAWMDKKKAEKAERNRLAEEKKKTDIDMKDVREEEVRMGKTAEINNEYVVVTLDNMDPVFLEGEPFAIIDNKYVPWFEAVVIAQENRVRLEQIKLKNLQSNPHFYDA